MVVLGCRPVVMKLPDYARLVRGDGSEAVLSTPAWYEKYDKDATVFVDARVWPPQLSSHPMRTAAATRRPDGQWVCVAKQHGKWRIMWFRSITAGSPHHYDDLPPIPQPTDREPDPSDDDGTIAQLVAFANHLIAIPFHGAAVVRTGDRPWYEFAPLQGRRYTKARTLSFASSCGASQFLLEWNGALFDDTLASVDAQDCTDLVESDGRLFALHETQLVAFDRELAPELAGHDVVSIERGPHHTLLITLAVDDERTTKFEHSLYDPRTRTVRLLGKTVNLICCAGTGDLVTIDERAHTLDRVSATDIAGLAVVAGDRLPPPPRHTIATLDQFGASSSAPRIATTGDSIAIALGRHLRIHKLDAPQANLEHRAPLIAVAAVAARFGALDGSGVLYEYTLDGRPIAARSVTSRPRSLVAFADRWVVMAADRVVLVDGDRRESIDISLTVAVASDLATGELVFAVEQRRLARWSSGDLIELPPTAEQIVGIAPLGGRKFVCLGERELYLLDLEMPELVRVGHRARRPWIAATGAGRVAWCPSASSLTVYELSNNEFARVPRGDVHYSSYSAPDNGLVTIHGIAFMDDGRIAIQLDAGRGNIVDPATGSALKLDPQPGDPASRWIFVTGKGVLIAD